MKRLLVCLIFLPTAILTITAASIIQYTTATKTNPPLINNLSQHQPSFVSLPQVLGASTAEPKPIDAMPQAVKDYVKDTPLEPYSDYIVETCNQYDPHTEYPLAYWYLAISMIESAVCKRIPHNSHNCTGWGIHSAGTLKYDSYEKAIEAWCKGFSQNYLNHPKWPKTTPDQVVKLHTPHSPVDPETGRRAWAIKVEYQLEKLMKSL